MENSLTLILCSVTGYLLGSVMGAFWVCRFFHLPDPTWSGSGNPGATNIYRLGGWLPALLTLAWDAVKGAISVTLALSLSLSIYEQGVVAMAALFGHMLPLFHKFKGGKGVATAFGCCLVLAPQTTLVLCLIWSIVAKWKRVSSIASLSGALAAPWVSWWLSPEYTNLFIILALFIVILHRDNIINLAKGKEGPL